MTHRNVQSRNWEHEDGWEPEWITGTIHVVGNCDYVECKQTVIGVGTYRVDYAINNVDRSYQGIDYSEFYQLRYFNPPLVLHTLPDVVPQSVRDAVDRAAPLIFVDPSYAATALRTSLELFLTNWGIPNRDDKQNPIRLHRRILLWQEATGQNEVAEHLLAVKWIGNSGSHEGDSLTVRAVIDGLEFMEAAFNELLVAPERKERVRAVNEAKGRLYGTE